MADKPIITISREYGSGGREIGKLVAKELGIGFYDRELIEMAAEESGAHVSVYEQLDETLPARSLFRMSGGKDGRTEEELFNFQSEAVLRAARGPCVIVGRCADFILRGHPNLIRMYIYADREVRRRRIIEEYGILPSDADTTLRRVDKQRAAYYNYHTDYNWGSIWQFDLCINTSVIRPETAAKLIKAYVELK